MIEFSWVNSNFDIVIIGGGAVGLSLAYHLGLSGGCAVRLFEANRLGSGTSWHAAGIVGPLRSSLNMTRIAMGAMEIFPKLEKLTGQATGYRQTGGLWLAQNHERLVELRRIHAMGCRVGLGVEMISAREIQQVAPHLKVNDLVGGLWVDEDAQVNPVDLCAAYAVGAKKFDVLVEENQPVRSILAKNGRVSGVLLDNGEQVDCASVVLCAGLWSRKLAAGVGVNVPLQGVEHMYVVTEPIDHLPDSFPVVRDLDAGIYLKGDTGKLIIGGFEKNAKSWDPASALPDEGGFLMFDEDWDQFEPFMHAGIHRMPMLETTGIQSFMNGPESFTPDTKPLIGESSEVAGLFVAAGFNSVGVMSSAGVGRELAEWILKGRPRFDMWEVDLCRASGAWNDSSGLKKRMQEAVYTQFSMHWPYKQPEPRVGLYRSPLFDRLKRAGAVFGCLPHWEVPLWYAKCESERKIVHTYGEQPWWPIANREAVHMADRVALVDLSQFSKFDISGKRALDGLQYLCAGNMDMMPGRSKYTVMLNESGGIEADVTVSRMSNERFRLVSGAATRYRDFARIRRLLESFDEVSVEDRTQDEAVLGVMGPRSRDVLSKVLLQDVQSESFPFGDIRQATMGGMPVVLMRRSYAGELGYEIYMNASDAPQIYDAILAAGTTFDIAHLGMLALDGCRIEKGFGHWSHEWGPDVTPIEAGIEFVIGRKKSGYIGCDAIEYQRTHGVSQRLVLLEVVLETTERPLLLRDELVMCNDEIVGLTTSGCVGPRTGKLLSFALVNCHPNESLFAVADKDYEIEVAGDLYRTRVLTQVPYDPDGMRMRG